MEIQVQGIAGEKGKKIGKAIADKIYMFFVATDPTILIN